LLKALQTIKILARDYETKLSELKYAEDC